MFRVGIIGCGGISDVHARVVSNMEGAALVAAADILPERAEALAKRFGCAAYEDYRRMLDEASLDAVHICAPHYLHPEMVQAAAERGVAAFTEKPPAIDEAGWETVLAAAQRIPVGVCFQNRYNPNVREAHRLAASGKYGALRGIRAFVTRNRAAEYYAAADWKGKWATEGGGALINQSIHTLDLILGFLGRPDAAEATMATHRLRGSIEVEDTAEIYLRRGNVPALLYASNGYSQDAPVLIELHLEGATIRLEGDRLALRAGDGDWRESRYQEAALGRAYWGAGHASCIGDFYQSLAERRPYANAPANCDITMRTLLELYDKAKG